MGILAGKKQKTHRAEKQKAAELLPGEKWLPIPKILLN